ncbi:MAG: hypothetical protein ACJ73N_15475, partial [Bryobacteraceae bacterium]
MVPGYDLRIRAGVMRRTRALLILALLVFGTSPAGAALPSPTNRRVWVGPKPSDLDDRWAVFRDGRWLAFRDPESNIAIYDLRASRIRTLPVRLPDQQWRAVFAWSTDNSQLVFNRLKGHGEELVAIAIRGGHQRALASLDGP